MGPNVWRRTARLIGGLALGTLLFVGLGAGVEDQPCSVLRTGSLLTIAVSSDLGSGKLSINTSQATWNPATETLSWSLRRPLSLVEPASGEILVVLQDIDLTVYLGGDPEIELEFQVSAGAAPITLRLLPMMITLNPPIIGYPDGVDGDPEYAAAEARARTGLAVVDLNADGCQIQTLGAPGSGMFQTQFEGAWPNGDLFVGLLETISTGPGGAAQVAQSHPPSGYIPLDFTPHSMSSMLGLSLSANDVVYGFCEFRTRWDN